MMGASFELRRGAPGDAAAIRALTRAAYAKWVEPSGREPDPMTADYEAAVRAHRFDLLYVDGALAALIETVDEGDVLLVENVAVAPVHQGRGLGSRLLTLADEIAQSEGKRRVRLYTNKLWAENIRLYERLGYRIDREEPVAPGLVRVHMSKAAG
jgi:ribosomal protein S18 acetylase RimI-like enzyme